MDFKTKHMFKLVTVLKKMGLSEAIAKATDNIEVKAGDNIEQVQAQVGKNIMLDVFMNIEQADKEVYDLLADINEVKAKDIREQDPAITMEMLLNVIQSKGFTSVLKFFNQK